MVQRKVKRVKVYKIVGKPGDGHTYQLTYSSSPKKAIAYYVKQGWKRSQLKAIPQ